MAARLIIVSERAELFSRIDMPDRDVFLWRDGLGDRALPEGVHMFRGDPFDPETFRPVAEGRPDLVAVLDFLEPDDAERIGEAILACCPGAAFLALCDGVAPALTEGAVVSCVEWPEFLRVDLESELLRVETQRRVARLMAFAEDVRVLPILVQPDPDPDAMASADAVRALLRRRPASAPIVSLGEVTRPENRRMAELLGLQVTTVELPELKGFEKLVMVDMQPRELGDDGPRLAVIDHHPRDSGYHPDFADVRPEYGATCTMLTEYLRVDDERRIKARLATGLLYGIKTDTNSLSRGATPSDVRAYAFLQARADAALLHRIERPAYPPPLVRGFGQALRNVQVEDDAVVAVMALPDSDRVHVLADLADFLIDMEGMRWAAAAAVVEDELVIKLRHAGDEPGAGDLAHIVTEARGSGGGHAAMAQAVLPLDSLDGGLGDVESGDASRALLELLRPALDRVRRKQLVTPRGKNRRAVVAAGS